MRAEEVGRGGGRQVVKRRWGKGGGTGSRSEGGNEPLVLFMVHTRAIRDAACDKFQRHFEPLGYHRKTAFVNVSEAMGKGVLPAELFQAATFIFCLFQSFERLPQKVLHLRQR